MSLWSRLFRRAEARAMAPSPDAPLFSGPQWYPVSVPGDLYMSLEEQLSVSVAWACVRAIVDPIAASEIKVYEDRDGKRTEEEEWLYHLLNVEPHPDYTSQGWSEAVLTGAVATPVGGFAFINRDGLGRAKTLQPLDPLRMSAEIVNGRAVYVYADPANGRVEIPTSEMIHVRGPRRMAGFYPDSPLARASAALALARAQEQYATSYYGNGAFPGVILKPPDAMRQGSVSKEQKQTIRDVFKALFGGPRKAHGIASLDPGWDLKIVETDAEKSQMVEARKAQIAEIARYFGVPGHLIGIPEASQGYGKNLAELGLGFVRQTLQPWARRVEEELRRKLMPTRRGKRWFLEYDLTRLTRGDEESVARAEEIGIRNGVVTINEARKARGLPSIKGGDETLLNGKPLATSLAAEKWAELKAAPEIYQYHLEQGLMTKNEVRERLGLPPMEGGDEITEPAQIKIDEHQAEIQAEAAEAQPDAEGDGKDTEPPDMEEMDEEDGKMKKPAAISPRDASVAMFADAFARHSRRIANHRANHRGEIPEADRPGIRARLAEDCAAALALVSRAGGRYSAGTVEAFSDALEAGEPPDKSAERFVSELWRNAA